MPDPRDESQKLIGGLSDAELQTYLDDVTWELKGLAPSDDGYESLLAHQTAAKTEQKRRSAVVS